ncbi:MAG TPA: SpoIVB peptidase S55 domain-containing protein [Bryobacteraceae bacterium]|nr:SpoIVB peptidase S55 domain-containing protein [Bryobacteraceae bacterium]
MSMNKMFRGLAFLAGASLLCAAPDIFPLRDVRAGQHGVGRTIFSGSRVEDFQVEILGVLENVGPGQSIILARLAGGPLDETGVMQGMSGSPVYIDGKLVGAVALGFQLAKAPIAGIRPIEEMLRVDPAAAPTRLASVPRTHVVNGGMRLEEIATPVSFSGFTSSALEHFAPQLRELGMDPRQGVSGGGRIPDTLGDPKLLEPGSMISVQLLAGDMSMSADGTVTAIDGNKLYAFGHRFLAEGDTEMPFARAEVLTLLPNLQSSFKISQAREWMGVIRQDRNTAIAGLTGQRAAMTPLEIHVSGNTYRMSMIQDRVMAPLVAQMALFSALDSTGRTVGPAAYTVRSRLDFESGPVTLNNSYSGDVSVAAVASAGLASPLSYALGSGFDAMKLKGVSIDVDVADRRSQSQIASVVTPRQVRPGGDLPITMVLAGDNGAEITKTVVYRVPVGAPPGTLSVTVADASTTNLLEYQAVYGTPAHSPAQVLSLLNGLRSNTSAWVRVWRNETDYTVEGRDLPDPPPSIAMILGRAQAGSTTLLNRGSKVAEIEMPEGSSVVTGSKTVQVEVKAEGQQ